MARIGAGLVVASVAVGAAVVATRDDGVATTLGERLGMHLGASADAGADAGEVGIDTSGASHKLGLDALVVVNDARLGFPLTGIDPHMGDVPATPGELVTAHEVVPIPHPISNPNGSNAGRWLLLCRLRCRLELARCRAEQDAGALADGAAVPPGDLLIANLPDPGAIDPTFWLTGLDASVNLDASVIVDAGVQAADAGGGG
jgi:hypothetical protein